MTASDPTSLSLDDLRQLRSSLQADDDAVSYVRRLVQARLDLVTSEQERRQLGADVVSGEDIADELATVLGTHLTAGGSAAPRPPRPTDDFSDHPLAVELDDLCAKGGTDLSVLSDDQLAGFAADLQQFEQARSAERKQLFGQIDALSAELVRRYREGEADVDGLLADAD